jgi:hypothetical protein
MYRVGSLALATALIAPVVAQATVLVEVPIDDMAFVADAIVVGRVDRVGTRLELSGPEPMPWTVSTIRVERWLHGGSGREVAIEELGGELQGTEVRVAGTPEYRAGERVLVFLRRDEAGRHRTYGMAQGKFTIRAAVDGPTLATRDLGEIAFAHWANGAMQVDHGHGHGDATTMSFAELIWRIEAVLAVRP